jgi:hypothetical protein
MINIMDFPKILSPFKRKINDKGDYVVYNEVEDGMDWVFNDLNTVAEEKINGTNVSIIIEEGAVTSVWNRTARIPFFNKGKRFISEAVLESYERGYCDLPDGQWFGEVIGPKLAGNPYKLDGHLWIPFDTFCRKHFAYRSYHKYPKTFDNLSDWLRKPVAEGGIFSIFARMRGMEMKPEGVVFHNVETGQMAKLRLDMFPWAKAQGISSHKSMAEAEK